MIFSDLFCYPCSTASYCSIFSVHFTHHFALQTKFGVVLGKLTIRYNGVDGHPNDDHSESVPGCWHDTFFKTIVLLRYVNSSYTFLVNFKSVGRRTAQPLDRLPWQPEVKQKASNFSMFAPLLQLETSQIFTRGVFVIHWAKQNRVLKGVNGNFWFSDLAPGLNIVWKFLFALKPLNFNVIFFADPRKYEN